MNKSKTAILESLDQKLERDIRIGSEGDNLKDTTINIYIRQLKKIYRSGLKETQWSFDEYLDTIRFPRMDNDSEFKKVYGVQNSNIMKVLFNIYTSKESLIMSINALCKMTKNRYKSTFDYYNKIRKVLSKQNKDEKLNNELTPQEEEKYISYSELMSVPAKVKSIILQKHGKLFIAKDELDKLSKVKKLDYLKLVFDYFALYLNVHYPLRLIWPTVLLTKNDNLNYLEGDKLHLNDFKNVRLMDAQVITLDSETMVLVKNFLSFITNTLHEKPTKLLWRLFNSRAGEYDYTSSTNGGFSSILARLFTKYNGKPISMNVIRHIVESHMIQSPNYSKLTNREKNDMHAKLLHSSYAANISYNKIANRAKPIEDYIPEPDNSYEPPPPSPPKLVRTKPRQMEPLIPIRVKPAAIRQKRRIFTGSFTHSGDRDIEIEIFEKV